MADQRFKVENGLVVSGANNIFTDQITIGGNTTVQGDLLLVQGNFTVQGTTTYTGSIYYDTDIIPLSNNVLKIGNGPSNTFIGNFGNTTIYAFIHPSANGIQLGNTTQRWDASITNLDASGILTLAGNVSVNSTALAVTSNASNKAVGINTAPISTAALYVVGNTSVNGSINIVGGGNLVVNGSITADGTITTTSNTMTIGKMLTVTNRTTINSNTATQIDSFTRASGKFAKYIITADNSTAATSLVHIIEMSLIHDNNGNVIVAKYGENFNTKLGLFDASANASHVIVTYQANSSVGLGATGANTTSITTIRQQILN